MVSYEMTRDNADGILIMSSVHLGILRIYDPFEDGRRIFLILGIPCVQRLLMY